MTQNLAPILFILCCIGAVSCNGGKRVEAPVASAGAAAEERNAPLGIEVCDDYLAAYSDCLESLPADQRVRVLDDWKAQKRSLARLAASPGTRPMAEQSCNEARSRTRALVKPLGCTL